ncbi:MAG: ThiF family adenylyltransferase [Opitutae bacterium]|nr:ThiF family adenylyltransferase [Opitutae bacterium]
MSRALIARNRDLRRLEDEGYTLRIVDEAYLLIDNVPYVTVNGEVQESALILHLTLSGEETVLPADHIAHIAYWVGEFPYEANGEKLLALIKGDAKRMSLSDSLPTVYELSAKPDYGYSDYYHKVSTYVEILSREARLISPDSTAQQWKVVPKEDEPDSVFHFADTATVRQNTVDLARKLRNDRVAIVGVGGTGSYVLDLVAKTWVREIHLFDDDPFLQHNAFRSPGSFSRSELEGGPVKSIFHAERYSGMRTGIIPHNTRIDEANVRELGAFDTVFLCMDGHRIKAQILETCMDHNTLLIDAGMGLYRVNGSIAGIIRATAFYPEHNGHAADCLDMAGDAVPGEYERNAQLAELNALNATLAVIKWKKVRGFYCDLERELNCEYVIDGNKLINSYRLGTPS